MKECVKRLEEEKKAAAAQAERTAPPPEPTPVVVAEPPAPRWGWKIGGIATAAVGAVLLGVSVKFGLDAKSDDDTVKGHVMGEPWTQEELDALQSGPDAEKKAIITGVAGGVALAAGAALALYGWFTDSDGTERLVTPTVSRDGVGFAFSATF